MFCYKTHSDTDTAAFGEALGRILLPGDALLLRGDLGAGKSVLARGAARALGVVGPMPSPTFTLMQPHQGAGAPVYHFDLYRITDMEEFYAAGLDEYVGAEGVALIEWPLDGLSPEPSIALSIERGDAEHERLIALDVGAFDRAREALDELKPWEAMP